MSVVVYNRHGVAIRRSRNLRGLLTHYRAVPDDIVVKVMEDAPAGYKVTFYFSKSGDYCETAWNDWRVLLDWVLARKTWSVARVTFDAPLYDQIEASDLARLTAFRKSGILLTRHPYMK